MANLYESMNKYFENKYGENLDNIEKVEKKSLNESKQKLGASKAAMQEGIRSRKSMKEARGRTSGKFTVQKALLDAHLDLPSDLSPESQKTAVKKALDVLKKAQAAAETDAEKKQYDRAINILTNRPTPVAFNSLGAWYSGISMAEQMAKKKRIVKESIRSRKSMKESVEDWEDRVVKTAEDVRDLFHEITAVDDDYDDVFDQLLDLHKDPSEDHIWGEGYRLFLKDMGYGDDYRDYDNWEDEDDEDEDVDESLKRTPKFRVNRRKVESLKSAPKRHKLGESKKIVSRKAMKESLGTDIDRYQKYVDYDMKHFGKISDKTQAFIDKAGLQVIKDKYGDYEVTAGHYDEDIRSRKAVKEDPGSDIDKYQKWVDYDMKRYHRISDITNKELKKAGLTVVKDDHGDYEVITEACGQKKRVEIIEAATPRSEEEEKYYSAIKEYVNGDSKAADILYKWYRDWFYDTDLSVVAAGDEDFDFNSLDEFKKYIRENTKELFLTGDDYYSEKEKKIVRKALGKKDLWEVVYSELTEDGSQYIAPETGKPRINKGAGYAYDTQVGIDRDGNIVVKAATEEELESAKTIAQRHKDAGDKVDFSVVKDKYDSRYPFHLTIKVELDEALKESKLTEKRWNYSVTDSIAKKFHDAVNAEDEDFERVRDAIIAVYDDIHDNTDLLDDDDYEDWVTEGVAIVDFDDEDDVNWELNNLYDFCDNAGIWIGI